MVKTTSKSAKQRASRTAGSTGQSNTRKNGAQAATGGAAEQGTDTKSTSMTAALTTASAIEALKLDHRKVEKLFKEYESCDDDRKSELIRQICSELIIHTQLEEEIFYPACRDAIAEEDLLQEAQVEHDSAKVLIADLLQGHSDDPYRDAKVTVLAQQIKHHVGEEEKPNEGIFAQAQARGIVDEDLARRLRERKEELQGRAAELQPTRAVSIQLSAMENDMARYSNDRDDRGRFMSDDGDRRGGGRDRDERGRFMSDDDDGRGNGRGGWFGDSEGHSRGARSRFDDDDRRGGYRGRSRDDDDDGRGHGRGGLVRRFRGPFPGGAQPFRR